MILSIACTKKHLYGLAIAIEQGDRYRAVLFYVAFRLLLPVALRT